MSMAVLPPRRQRQVFLENNSKMHESEQKFSVRKCKTMKLNESYRLVTSVLILSSHSRKIHNIFLTTIAATARSRHSYFWARGGSVAVGFLFLSPRRGSGQFLTAMDISVPYTWNY
jgi:hypothetical protein